MPLDQAARALEHPAGTPETNRGGWTQIEHVGFAATSEDWPDARWQAIAALCRWIEAQTGCPAARLPGTIWGTDHPARVGGQAFFAGKGHAAHQHAANNHHWDWGEGNIAAVLDVDDSAHRPIRAGDTGPDVAAFQRACNLFIARYCHCRPDRRLDVDGIAGPKTIANGRWIASMLGLNPTDDTTRVPETTQVRVRHTNRRSKAQIARGARRRRRHCKCKTKETSR